MPLQYDGVLVEHQAVRSAAGVFDVSHLGRFSVSGPGAVAAVRNQLCNDIARVAPGRAQYTMALNEHGGVEDDIIVWWLEDELLWVMPNGTNFDDVMGRFGEASPETVSVSALRSQTALLAVQGPDSHELLVAVLGSAPGRFRIESGTFRGARYTAAGTGYTGERGAEIAVPAAAGAELLAAFLDAGATACGLGARDTLRLEMGYLLWGQDLDQATTPLDAGLGWVVAWDHEFVGRTALEQHRSNGIAKELVAFRTEGRTIPRHGHRLRAGAALGAVTSGNFSPVLGRGIGMGYLGPPPSGEAIEVEIRGSWTPTERVTPPFIAR